MTPGTFWGWFGRASVPLPQILVDLLTVTCTVLVLVGMFRYRHTLRSAVVLATPIALTLVLMLRVSWGAYVDTTSFRGMHGRYFYPVIIPLIALGALALMNLVRDDRARKVFGVGAVAVSAAMPFLGLWTLFLHVYADSDIFALPEGFMHWVSSMSPVPAAVTLALPLAFASSLVVGTVVAVRALRSRVPVPGTISIAVQDGSSPGSRDQPAL